MKPEERFGLDGVKRRQQAIKDAGKPVKMDKSSRLGAALVNLPWFIVVVMFLLIWLLKK